MVAVIYFFYGLFGGGFFLMELEFIVQKNVSAYILR